MFTWSYTFELKNRMLCLIDVSAFARRNEMHIGFVVVVVEISFCLKSNINCKSDCRQSRRSHVGEIYKNGFVLETYKICWKMKFRLTFMKC